MENKDIMALARAHLRGNWDIMAATFLIYLVITGVLGAVPVFGWIGDLLIGGPLLVGLHILSLSLVRDRGIRAGQLFDGFADFLDGLAAYILMIVYIILWSLLFLIPGLIAALSYSMTYFVLADNPKMSGQEAIRRSKLIMKGNKWTLSCLAGRFTGWFLLGIITMGIGFIWIGPYFMASLAVFYDQIQGAAVPVQPAPGPFPEIVPGR
jgi:uncharacterized membrane protein